MRISPVTNTQIVVRPSFGQKANLKLSKNEAQLLLDNYKSISREHFQDGLIYTGIAKLSFNNWDGKQNIENFKKLFVHTLIDLGMKVEELRSDIAFSEAIEQNNIALLRLMFNDMKMLPITPERKVNFSILYPSVNSTYMDKDVAIFLDKAWRYAYDQDIFGTYVPPVRDNSAKLVLLNQVKEMINKDEDAEGLVSLDTINQIVSNPEFNKIKDESLNISGSRVLHLLTELAIDINNKDEVNLVQNIIKKCADAGYNFDIKNDFGETAVDKATEAGNGFLAKLLNNRGCVNIEDKNIFFTSLFHKRRT